MTSLRPDQISLTAATFTSTSPIGNTTSRITSSVMSVSTLLAFFGHEIQIMPLRSICRISGLAVFSSTARDAVKGFKSDLPDYTAEMAVTRFYSPSNPPRWQQIDVATAQVVRKGGHEEFRDVMVNGKQWPRPSEHVNEWAADEFFSTLDVVLLPGVRPAFVKRGVEKVGTRTAQLYEANVKAEESNWVVKTEDGSQHKSAYKARVWIDAESRRVLKVEQKAVGLPSGFPLDRAETVVEFALVPMASGTAFAPVRGENVVCRRGGGSCSKSAVEFKNYR